MCVEILSPAIVVLRYFMGCKLVIIMEIAFVCSHRHESLTFNEVTTKWLQIKVQTVFGRCRQQTNSRTRSIRHVVRRVLRDRPHIKGRSRKHVDGQVKKNLDRRAVCIMCDRRWALCRAAGVTYTYV